MLQIIFTVLGAVVDVLGAILPDSPFHLITDLGGLSDAFVDGISYINWFVPVQTMLVIFGAWCAALAAYWSLSIFGRLRTILAKVSV